MRSTTVGFTLIGLGVVGFILVIAGIWVDHRLALTGAVLLAPLLITIIFVIRRDVRREKGTHR